MEFVAAALIFERSTFRLYAQIPEVIVSIVLVGRCLRPFPAAPWPITSGGEPLVSEVVESVSLDQSLSPSRQMLAC